MDERAARAPQSSRESSQLSSIKRRYLTKGEGSWSFCLNLPHSSCSAIVQGRMTRSVTAMTTMISLWGAAERCSTGPNEQQRSQSLRAPSPPPFAFFVQSATTSVKYYHSLQNPHRTPHFPVRAGNLLMDCLCSD